MWRVQIVGSVEGAIRLMAAATQEQRDETVEAGCCFT